MAQSGQCSQVGCYQLPSIISALHHKAKMKVSSHSPHRNNMDPAPEITVSLKEVAFASAMEEKAMFTQQASSAAHQLLHCNYGP